MPTLEELYRWLDSDEGGATLAHLYGNAPETLAVQRQRYRSLLEKFGAAFPKRQEVHIFSAPGRTEVGGNHTDHNAGRILAAAVDLDIIAVVAPNAEGRIRVNSEGYPPSELSTGDLEQVEAEKFTSAALIRGVAARFQQLGYKIGGFDAVSSSLVPKGSGLSSSAAYEVLMATILNRLYNQGQLDPVLLARIAQFSENQYFGKPCGLMDQTTIAVGGFVTIDFKDFNHPIVKKVDFDFDHSGSTLVISDTWGDHADLNDEYTALEHEMKAVARALGGQVLREFSEQQVLDNLHFLRKRVNDRAILRAVHFYRDDRRVVEQVQALEAGDFQRFLDLVIDSGESSWMLCQNVYSCQDVDQQSLSIALLESEALLKGRGAWRVHGGGFAGTIQAFVPHELLLSYVNKIERVFGKDSCHKIRIRPAGAVQVSA